VLARFSPAIRSNAIMRSKSIGTKVSEPEHPVESKHRKAGSGPCHAVPTSRSGAHGALDELVAGGTSSGIARVTDAFMLLTAAEVADLLRTSRKAIYTMVERGQLPGVTRIGRRVLLRHDDLLDWLRQKSMPSLER
jgi:excisionase family DNA binding protein